MSASEPDERESFIVDTLVDAFSELMESDPDAFRTKFRKMAADPFAFYRGSACVFYADVSARDDRWADERTSRIWIQGDLHAENFGTSMDGSGVLIFDVNDFDEAYVGHFTWDVQRFVASVALMCWQKALSDETIAMLIETFSRAYVRQVRWFVDVEDENDRRFRNASGVVRLDDSVKDVIAKTGFGIGSAGLPSYTVLIEGFDQALDDFTHHGHRRLPAGTAGARRPAARLHRHRRGRVRRQRTLAV